MHPFHVGEIEIQTRAGVQETALKAGSRMIRDFMPDQHREFFEQESTLFLSGLIDANGHPWATPIMGTSGRVRSPTSTTLEIDALPLLTDADLVSVNSGDKIGLLGIELATRRRNRVNGSIQAINGETISIKVEQSFGNCAKFIQIRDIDLPNENKTLKKLTTIKVDDEKFLDAVRLSDTVFIASRAKQLSTNSSDGVDVSHRGGNPGFLLLTQDELAIPDFSGNNFFNTLGNISLDDRVGLFFPNFIDNEVYWVQGHAKISWDKDDIKHFSGAERIIRIKISRILVSDEQLAILRFDKAPVYSPQLKKVGYWN